MTDHGALHRIGDYLDRTVRCAAIQAPRDLEALDLTHRLVFFYAGDSRVDGVEMAAVAGWLARGRPLGVFFSGADAETMFDALLRALDGPGVPISVMTNLSRDDLGEAIDEFLSSEWPPEDRWDAWTGYLLVGLGAGSGSLEEAAGRKLAPDR